MSVHPAVRLCGASSCGEVVRGVPLVATGDLQRRLGGVSRLIRTLAPFCAEPIAVPRTAHRRALFVGDHHRTTLAQASRAT